MSWLTTMTAPHHSCSAE